MAKNRYINTKLWSDSYIQELDPNTKLFFLYLLTNEHTNIAGIYEISLKTMSFECGIDEVVVWECLERLKKDKKAYYLEEYVIICNFVKYQESKTSPKVQQGIIAILSELPEKVRYPMDTLSIPYVYPTNYINSNSNSNYIEANASMYHLKEKNMDTIYLDEYGEPVKGQPLPKKYTSKKKLYSRLAVYYMGLVDKQGNVLRHFPAVKEIIELCDQEHPDLTEEQTETEIKARIKIAHKHYKNIGCDWGLGKVAENWNKILKWKK